MINTEQRSQKLANKKWRKHHRDKDRLYSDRSAAKRYIRKENDVSRLKALEKIIKHKIKLINKTITNAKK